MYWLFLPSDWRRLKNLILALLKSGAASEVKRINYAKSYILVDWKIVKQEQKLILIDWDNKSKIENIIKKSSPELTVELFDLWLSGS